MTLNLRKQLARDVNKIVWIPGRSVTQLLLNLDTDPLDLRISRTFALYYLSKYGGGYDGGREWLLTHVWRVGLQNCLQNILHFTHSKIILQEVAWSRTKKWEALLPPSFCSLLVLLRWPQCCDGIAILKSTFREFTYIDCPFSLIGRSETLRFAW